MKNINIEEKFDEYKDKKKKIVDNNLPISGRKTRKLIRPLMRKALLIQRKLNKQTIKKMGNIKYKFPKNKPVIFVVSHIGKYDFEIVNELIKKQFYVIASDFRNMYGNFNGLMMNVFGVVFVDELSKEDKEYTSKMMKKILKTKSFFKNTNIMIFSEGTWNITENEPIMDIHLGAVDAALETNAVILPISVEQYDKNFVVNFGEFYDPSNEAIKDGIDYNSLDESIEKERLIKLRTKIKANTILRDQLATLKYEIWEATEIVKRKDIPKDYWEEFINARLREWPGYSMQEQIDSVYHPKEKKEKLQIEDDLKKIKIDDNNSYLLASNERYNNYLNVRKNSDEILEELLNFRQKAEEESCKIKVKK